MSVHDSKAPGQRKRLVLRKIQNPAPQPAARPWANSIPQDDDDTLTLASRPAALASSAALAQPRPRAQTMPSSEVPMVRPRAQSILPSDAAMARPRAQSIPPSDAAMARPRARTIPPDDAVLPLARTRARSLPPDEAIFGAMRPPTRTIPPDDAMLAAAAAAAAAITSSPVHEDSAMISPVRGHLASFAALPARDASADYVAPRAPLRSQYPAVQHYAVGEPYPVAEHRPLPEPQAVAPRYPAAERVAHVTVAPVVASMRPGSIPIESGAGGRLQFLRPSTVLAATAGVAALALVAFLGLSVGEHSPRDSATSNASPGAELTQPPVVVNAPAAVSGAAAPLPPKTPVAVQAPPPLAETRAAAAPKRAAATRAAAAARKAAANAATATETTGDEAATTTDTDTAPANAQPTKAATNAQAKSDESPEPAVSASAAAPEIPTNAPAPVDPLVRAVRDDIREDEARSK